MNELALNKPSNLIPTKIVSVTPGRLRLRIAPSHRQPWEMERIANILEAQPNVSRVQTNVSHGSIVIHHDAQDESWKNLLATLTDIGIIVGEITTTHTEAAEGVANAVLDLNKRVEQLTNGSVDLRFLFPLGLSILAVRQLLIKGLQFEIIPWYVLAWYSFDSFIKLHGISQPQQSIKSQES